MIVNSRTSSAFMVVFMVVGILGIFCMSLFLNMDISSASGKNGSQINGSTFELVLSSKATFHQAESDDIFEPIEPMALSESHLSSTDKSTTALVEGDVSDTIAPAAAEYIQTNDIIKEANMGEIKIRYSFETPDIKDGFQTCYESVVVPELQNRNIPGEPVVPFKTASILIPYDRDIEEIEVVPGNETYLGKIFFEPGQEEIPTSRIENLTMEVTPPSETIYASEEPYPKSVYSVVGIQDKKGYKILYINLYPIKYIPKTMDVYYFDEFDIIVTTKHAETLDNGLDSSLFRGDPEDKESIVTMVDNPEYVTTYVLDIKPLGISPLIDGEYDYVIITSQSLKNCEGPNNFQTLVEWKNSRGVKTIIVTVEDIYANYDGVDGPEKIRNFITDAYLNNGIEYVLLGGDADGDDVGGESGNNIVPARGLWAEDNECNPPNIPADLYYACLNGNYDNDGDRIYGEPTDGPSGGEVDFLAEVYVGRAPVDSCWEVANFVRKTIDYEKSYGDPYLSKVLMIGQEYEGRTGSAHWGGNCKDEIKDGSCEHGYCTVGFPDCFDKLTLYDRDLDPDWSKSDLIDIINSNIHTINHKYHTNNLEAMRMDCSDVDALTNNKYFFGYSQGCYAGAFDNRDSGCNYIDSDCILEHFVTENSGAFGFVGNSRSGWSFTTTTDGSSQRYDRQFWDAIFGEGILNVGRANQDSKEDNLGSLYERDKMRFCYYELNLLGDPETPYLMPLKEWVRTFDVHESSSVRQTNDGGYIIAGDVYTDTNGCDIYLIKTYSDGSLEWSNTFGGSYNDFCGSIRQTEDGGYIIVGTKEGNILLIKTYSDGSLEWDNIFTEPGYDWGYSVQQTKDGGYIIVGTKEGNILLIKTYPDGSLQWSKEHSISDSDVDIGYSVQQTNDGGYIITGAAGYMPVSTVLVNGSDELSISSSVDHNQHIASLHGELFNTSAPKSGYEILSDNEGLFLMKTYIDGTIKWTNVFCADYYGQYYEGRSVQQTKDGGYIIVGNKGGDIHLIKTDSDGNQKWIKTFDGTDHEYGYEVQQTNDCGYIIVGDTWSSGRALLIKTDLNGNEVWRNTFNVIGYDNGNSVQQTEDGGYIIAGDGCSASGEFTTWLIKLRPDTLPLAKVLLVDDDSGADYERYYEDALAANRCGYVKADESPSSGYMSKFDCVIWVTGDDWSTTLTNEERTNLAAYLDNGGRLFISGQDVGYYLNYYDSTGQEFYQHYLHALYSEDNTGLYTLNGVDGDPVSSKMTIDISRGDGANNQYFPSEISPTNGASAVFNYEGDGCGAIRADTGTYKVVYFAFGFEAINSEETRNKVMSKVLDYLLERGWVNFASYNYPTRYIRHSGFLGEVAEIASSIDKKDSTFSMVPGLADSSCVSFESVNFPGYYIRHSGFRLKLSQATEDQLFKEDATFRRGPGLADTVGSSFESYNFPGRYIRHSGFHLYVQSGDSELFKADATFAIEPCYVSLASSNYPTRYIRHCGFLGEMTEIGSALDEQDSTFRMVPGLADSSNSSYISFESVNFPGYYLRHSGFRLKLSQATEDQLFKEDATFKMVAGLSNPAESSFESYNFPGRYIRHSGFHLYVQSGDSELFKADATFWFEPPKYQS